MTPLTWSELQSTCGYRCRCLLAPRDHYHRNKRPPATKTHLMHHCKKIKRLRSGVVHLKCHLCGHAYAKFGLLSHKMPNGKHLEAGHIDWMQIGSVRTCFPLCILFLRSTGVLPVVTHTPASVLLYTSFSSITPWPFSCCKPETERERWEIRDESKLMN